MEPKISFVEKFVNWSRIGSFLAIVLFVFSLNFIEDSFALILFQKLSLIGLISILFGNIIGGYIGPMWSFGRLGTTITAPSPGFLIKFVGWIILLIPITYEVLARIYT